MFSLTAALSVPLYHSNDILQFDQPAVQHHLRVLHWGHLSSHDGLQHVSCLLAFVQFPLTSRGQLRVSVQQ